MSLTNLTSENFKETINNSQKVVLVDFYADWCVPCKMLSPVIEEISDERDDVDVYRVNSDEAPDIAMEYMVRSIPCLISFKDGQVYKKSVGVQPKENILELID